MEEDYIEKIDELKESPLYNLSMSSLENFHTNFLVWLGNKHPEQMWTLLTGEQETPPKIKFEAQKNCGNCKFDLCVEKDRQIILVLENKIKSYPTEEQLEKYNEGIEHNKGNFSNDCKKILLTLFPCNLKLKGLNWKPVYYADFFKNNPFMPNSQEFSYHNELIKDYFNLIKNLYIIINKYDENITHTKYDMYDISKNYEAIKFKNIYIKYRTFELMNFIKQYVEESVTENIKFSTDFSNSNEGIINIEKKYIIEKTKTNNKKDNYDFILSIQIQGSQYRYCLVCLDGKQENNKKRFDFAESLKGNKYWFNDTENNYNIRKNNPYQTLGNGNKYLSYKPDRIYQYKKIENFESKKNLADVTYESIATQVLEDIQRLNKNEQEIIKCYTETLSPKNS